LKYNTLDTAKTLQALLGLQEIHFSFIYALRPLFYAFDSYAPRESVDIYTHIDLY